MSLPVKDWKANNIYGIIIYSEFKENMSIHPGYVYVNSDNNIKDEESKEDNIYEKLFSSLFKSVPANVDVIVSAFCRKKKSK